jgi:hypothetical protein
VEQVKKTSKPWDPRLEALRAISKYLEKLRGDGEAAGLENQLNMEVAMRDA